MGRLFWKFFFSIWLAQVISVLAISGGVWIKDRNRAQLAENIELGPPAYFMLNAAEVTLRAGGVAALRELADKNRHEQLYMLDENGHDLLGREVSPVTLEQVRQLQEQNAYSQAVRTLTAPDGSKLLVYAMRRGPGHGPGPRHDGPPPGDSGWEGRPPPRDGPPPGAPPSGGPMFDFRLDPHFPLIPMLVGVLASFISAALLAWHFAKPIRNLRTAFDAVAAGRLEARIGPAMGARRDELADLGQDFDRMATRLQELVEGQRRLLHDVSHELRSPLARLQAAIGLARQRPEKAETMLERIERESARMDGMIGELLTLSRLEAGVAGLMDDSVDLSELVADLVEDARFEARALGKNVIFRNGEHATVRGRAELLHSAIENVVRNAIRHTVPASSVVVSVDRSGADGMVHVSVLDYGPGVPEDELEAIFRPFVRSSTANGIPGHGLGLAIAQRVIKAHGGTIAAFNAEEGGLLVDIRLPAA